MKKILCVLILLAALDAHAQKREVTLDECLELCESNSCDIRNAGLDISAAEAQIAEARWEFFPTVSINALAYRATDPLLKITPADILGKSDNARVLAGNIETYAYENGLRPYYSAFHHGYGSSITALQPLYAGGRISSGNRLADMNLEATRLKYDMSLKSEKSEIEKKFFRILALQEKMATLLRAEALLDSLEKDVLSAREAGIVTDAAPSQVRLKKSGLASGKTQLKNGLRLAKMDLFNSIGLKYSYLEIDSFALEDGDDSVCPPSSYIVDGCSIDHFEETRLLDLQVDASRLEMQMAKGEGLPQIAIGFSYGVNDMMGTSSIPTFSGIGFATVQIPVTGFGKASAKARRHDAMLKKAENERDFLRSQLALQLDQLRMSMESSWELLCAAEDVVENAGLELKESVSSYEAGYSSLSDLLQAELSYRTAEEELADRRLEYRQAVSDYLRRVQ